MEQKMSAATKRAIERNYFQSPEWFCNFSESEITGLEQEEGIHRRDPSTVIKVGDLFYVYYSKSYGPHVGFNTGDDDAKVFPWDYTEIWYATSPDGYVWEEKGMALGRGEAGEYDDRSVFTPEILHHEDKFYLVYQVVKHPYKVRSFESIAIAHADNPGGPFTRSAAPILEPQKDGVWLTGSDEGNRFLVEKKGSFDGLKVHDPILYPFKGKFYLYYKGEPMGEQFYMGGRETKWGVAIADNILGPYTRSEYNPVTNSGHETCVWRYQDGIAAFLRTDGVEKNTMQYAEDGINFEIKSVIPGGPEACGPYRSNDPLEHPLDGMKWGLSHNVHSGYGFLVRFDRNDQQKIQYTANRPFE